MSGSEWLGVSEGNERLLGGGGGQNLRVCDRERKGEAAREGVHCMRERVCMQLDEKFSVDWLLLCYTGWEKRQYRPKTREKEKPDKMDWLRQE